MRTHFIAIGGAAMHNLALALKSKGHIVTGSDDEIFEPSRSRLEKAGILPKEFGWFPEKIVAEIEAIVLGMHAREDNPELIRAKELGLKIYSYPEFLYEQTKNKKRVIIGGSHGKTTVTSMIMHVMRLNNMQFDYMVGAQVQGFDTMVSLSEETELAIFEGDEYLSSPIDRRPKFHLYKPHIALINGIGWDHINVFPSFENYLKQFEKFIDVIEPNGKLFYYAEDKETAAIVMKSNRTDILFSAYNMVESTIENGKTFLTTEGKESVELGVFGEHNLQNLSAAMEICIELGISKDAFLKAVSSFKGSAKRLECFYSDDTTALYLDFAHAPSKVKGVINAVKQQFADWNIIACLELHTFSSLNKEFIKEYHGVLDGVDKPIVFFNPEVVKHKKLPELSVEFVSEAFNNKSLKVVQSTENFKQLIKQVKTEEKQVYLFMSSGSFGGLTTGQIKEHLLG